MLRAHIETTIKNSPYSEPVGGFLFGFSSTLIGVGSVLLLLIVVYDYYRFDKRSILMKVYSTMFHHTEFVLPLYQKRIYAADVGKKDDDSPETTAKPDLSAFVVPGIMVDSYMSPSTPISTTGLKRRIGSESPFIERTNSTTSFGASVSTISSSITDPFDPELKSFVMESSV